VDNSCSKSETIDIICSVIFLKKDIMQKKNFAHLKEHFVYETFQLDSQHRFVETAKKYYEKIKFDTQGYNFINAFYEKDTDYIFHFNISQKDDFKNDAFEFYLKQLPVLDLSNITYLFTLTNWTKKLLPNAFEFATDYPSEFCKEFLKDTYGKVIYPWQYMQLLSCCLQGEANNHTQINEYRRWYNLRMAKMFTILETLYLPDGYSLTKLLQEHTPLTTTEEDYGYGFVSKPDTAYSWEFIQRAKKYIQTT
jgi:hypothetical protein